MTHNSQSEVGSPELASAVKLTRPLLPDGESQVRRRHAQRPDELLKQIAAVTNVSAIRDLPARKCALSIGVGTGPSIGLQKGPH